ncbi:hypothetical protein [Ohtaekwangia koreensis]|jgi:hypothetical protein|uniref:Quinol oxidase subunit 4 n=1 Tax=Ohtaekwangia koreensis TaxID=688867 RepID=A0A1T5J5V4_9BACT|nr:hypothetical protein [Ohtaekwangia koreensis]SKC46638.1 hypothetical protein SAMN05660236_0768 [Ohtaekwangia koreensis]
MKEQIRRMSWIFMLLLVLSSACKTVIVNNNKKVPPGQMKKATGSKSAKPYAPGQQKKGKH